MLDSLLEGCQVIGFDWRYLYVNAAAARQGQRPPEQLLGRTMAECYPGIDATPMFSVLRRCMSGRASERMENEFNFPDGTRGWFELRLLPVPAGACILSLDITEAKKAAHALQRTESQLRHAQKMEAVGRLAGGIAHDFNNILSVVLSYGNMLLADLKPGDPMRADVEEITSAGQRAAELTRQLLLFSRQEVIEPKVIDLNEVLLRLDKMLRRVLGADVDLVSVPTTPLGRVRVDPGGIDQVLMNLVVNARDAMPTGGKLTLETGNVVLDDAYVRQHVGAVPGPHVMLAVTDTGTGIDKETTERIFEPFFTTKGVGKGTGLGLSTVFGIVKQSRGTIWVYSEPGKGTTFKVYLPTVDAEADEVESRPTPPASLSVGGSETILLVEDDAQVRAAVRGILEWFGYRVVAPASVTEALVYAVNVTEHVDLLLTDVVMPQMSGPELTKRVMNARPEIKVLFMSGYTDDTVVRHGVLEAGFAYLQKPITPDALAGAVRAVLDRKRPRAPK